MPDVDIRAKLTAAANAAAELLTQSAQVFAGVERAEAHVRGERMLESMRAADTLALGAVVASADVALTAARDVLAERVEAERA